LTSRFTLLSRSQLRPGSRRGQYRRDVLAGKETMGAKAKVEAGRESPCGPTG
jgi:hypothetical protein